VNVKVLEIVTSQPRIDEALSRGAEAAHKLAREKYTGLANEFNDCCICALARELSEVALHEIFSTATELKDTAAMEDVCREQAAKIAKLEAWKTAATEAMAEMRQDMWLLIEQHSMTHAEKRGAMKLLVEQWRNLQDDLPSIWVGASSDSELPF